MSFTSFPHCERLTKLHSPSRPPTGPSPVALSPTERWQKERGAVSPLTCTTKTACSRLNSTRRTRGHQRLCSPSSNRSSPPSGRSSNVGTLRPHSRRGSRTRPTAGRMASSSSQRCVRASGQVRGWGSGGAQEREVTQADKCGGNKGVVPDASAGGRDIWASRPPSRLACGRALTRPSALSLGQQDLALSVVVSILNSIKSTDISALVAELDSIEQVRSSPRLSTVADSAG